jgi:acyl-CoA dehydrogenase
MIERAIEETVKYTRERKAFGKAVMDFQNTQFVLADAKAKATVARVFCNWAVGQLLEKKLDAYTASMAKLWVTDEQVKIIDECLQLHGGYGYMNEYPIAQMYRDARVQKIYGGTNEIMKVLIARSL